MSPIVGPMHSVIARGRRERPAVAENQAPAVRQGSTSAAGRAMLSRQLPAKEPRGRYVAPEIKILTGVVAAVGGGLTLWLATRGAYSAAASTAIRTAAIAAFAYFFGPSVRPRQEG